MGKMATLSHTASLSGEDGLYDAAFSQAGAIRAASLAEMIEIAKVLATQPPMPGRRVGVLTTSGSLGAMTADALFEEGLQLASWSPEHLRKGQAGGARLGEREKSHGHRPERDFSRPP